MCLPDFTIGCRHVHVLKSIKSEEQTNRKTPVAREMSGRVESLQDGDGRPTSVGNSCADVTGLFPPYVRGCR